MSEKHFQHLLDLYSKMKMRLINLPVACSLSAASLIQQQAKSCNMSESLMNSQGECFKKTGKLKTLK